MGPRNGAMYFTLESEAKEAGLCLKWPSRLPNTRQALAAAEWVRRHQPEIFRQFHNDLFAAHFSLGQDIGDPFVIERYATDLGINVADLHAALSDDSALKYVTECEMIGLRYGVQGTPAWLIADRLVSGIFPATEFERLAQAATQVGR